MTDGSQEIHGLSAPLAGSSDGGGSPNLICGSVGDDYERGGLGLALLFRRDAGPRRFLGRPDDRARAVEAAGGAQSGGGDASLARSTGVATENLIRRDLSCEVPNRVIIPPDAGDGRTAVVLAGFAGEVSTPARRRESCSPPSVEHSAPAGIAAPPAVQCGSAGIRLALSPLPCRSGCRRHLKLAR
jgi:hypothetical protein